MAIRVDVAARMAALVARSLFISLKAAAATIELMLSGYENDLRELIQALLRGGGRFPKYEFRRQMKSVIRDYAREGFRVAWEEGGGDIEETTSDEFIRIQEWSREQQSYVDDFADWLKAKESDLDLVPQRLEMWTSSYASFLNEIKLLAQGDPVGVWEYGDTDHCDTCLELNGQRHRISWFTKQGYYPGKPGAEMDCGGYRCQCQIRHPKTGERLL